VPLSFWQLQEHHTLALIEAGISQAGEMQQLQSIVQPDLGIITNIGDAHSEGFSSIEEKLREKLRLFHGVKVLVYCRDHALIHAEVVQLQERGLLVSTTSWGMHPGSDLVVSKASSTADHTHLQVKYKGEIYPLQLLQTDPVSIENALHCFAMAVVLGKAHQVIDAMKELPPLSMRLEIKEGQLGSTIINDSYSADLSGLLSALEFMSLQHPQKERIAILSDITGIRGDDQWAYQKLVVHLNSNKVNTLFAVGDRFAQHAALLKQAGIDAHFFESASSLLHQLHQLGSSTIRDKVILVKGARVFQFEKISQLVYNYLFANEEMIFDKISFVIGGRVWEEYQDHIMIWRWRTNDPIQNCKKTICGN
jgi:alanine racemase